MASGTANIQAAADAAISHYQLSDPAEQRQLLIEINMVVGGGDDDPELIPPSQ